MTRSRESAVALAVIAIAVSAACAGCAGLSLMSLAPTVAVGAAQMVGAQVAMKQSKGGIIGTADEAERCDELLRTAPGVEEVRKTPDGLIESRQWKIVEHEGNPTWMLVRTGDSSGDAWRPKPGIAKLNFKPPLYQMLPAKEPQILAYAPADVTNPSDSEQLNSMTAAFGAGMGTFEWRERTYSYVVVKELPCFKPVK
ncbi:MAG: hypothetical protein Q7S58_11800 [Candidatus Binatus sp.]|uniref:hypothetical protein n=1 Tax=Candidatus Binatus sp. TaxID=2811406 RepID=UPI00271BF63D|nr:hypothetical protein [Candidatus Binatus sp.]MDO8433082.1 hypothetical protein [Candidatus Binatus sp.]